jgi:hypothetical protein
VTFHRWRLHPLCDANVLKHRARREVGYVLIGQTAGVSERRLVDFERRHARRGT